MLGPIGIGCQERNVYFCLESARQLMLCFFCSIFQPLDSKLVTGNIHSVFLFKLFLEVFNNFLVNIIAAKMGIATSPANLNRIFRNFKNRYVKRATAKIINNDFLVFLFVKAVRKSRR